MDSMERVEMEYVQRAMGDSKTDQHMDVYPVFLVIQTSKGQVRRLHSGFWQLCGQAQKPNPTLNGRVGRSEYGDEQV